MINKTGMVNYLLCDDERWCCEGYRADWLVFPSSGSYERSLCADWCDTDELLLSVSGLGSVIGRRSVKRGSVGLPVSRGSLEQSKGISFGCGREGPLLRWGREVEAVSMGIWLTGVLGLLTGGWERLRDGTSRLRIFLTSFRKSRSCVLITVPRLAASSINAPQSLCSCGKTRFVEKGLLRMRSRVFAHTLPWVCVDVPVWRD